MPRQLTLLGTIHSDPLGMKRLYRAVTSLRPTITTFELEKTDIQKIVGFETTYRSELVEWMEVTFNILPEQKKEFETFLRNYGFESKIAFGWELLGNIVRKIDDETAERDGSLIILSKQKSTPTFIKEYQDLVGIIYNKLSYIKEVSEREVIAICGAYVFFDLTQQQEIVNYQYETGLQGIKFGIMPSTIQRDRTMEERIRAAWEETDGDLLHVGGLFHIYGPYDNLYTRLQDLQPIRRKLNEF